MCPVRPPAQTTGYHLRMSDRRLDAAWACACAAIAVCLYSLTVCRTVYWYDSAEYVAAAVVLGIPHPPGYPLYTLIGHVFTWLPVDPALAVNLMSAVFGAVAVALAFVVVRQLGAARWASALGALALATSGLFWSQAVIAEVYTPGLAFLLGVIALTLHGIASRRSGLLVAAAALAGLGLGVHLSIATCGIGLAYLVVSSEPRWKRRLAVASSCAAATVAGASIFLYLPLRASMRPVLNFGDPSTWDAFAWMVTGGNYKHWFLHDYDLAERCGQVAGIFYGELLIVGLGLALIGLVSLARKRPHYATAFALMIAGNVYTFFNYGVHDLAVFFLPSIALLFCLVGVGADALVAALPEYVSPHRRRAVRGLAVCALAGFPLSSAAINYSAVDLSDFTDAQDYGQQLAADLPAGAVIINFTTPPEWVVDTVFTHYFQKVRGVRRDVRVITKPSVNEVDRLLRNGVPVYMFAPVPAVARLFEVQVEGRAFRVVARRR